MRRFASLYDRLDRTNSTQAKVDAIVDYFRTAPRADAAWAVFFLSGERLRTPFRARDLVEWTCELAGVDAETFAVSYQEVGDRAETIALLLDAMPHRVVDDPWTPTLAEAAAWVDGLRTLDRPAQRAAFRARQAGLEVHELFVLLKLATGGLRVGVSKRLLVRALSRWSGVDAPVLFHRLMGGAPTTADGFAALFTEDESDADRARPYPFFLASPLERAPDELGDAAEWTAEWKWDGVRGQLVRRGEVALWSRGEELITAQFPEVVAGAAALPEGVVLDGEVLAWRDEAPLPFAALQRRLNKKRVGRKLLADVPCAFVAYDVLEVDGRDLRDQPLTARRERLERIAASAGMRVSPSVPFRDWAELAAARASSRERGVEGLMLKRRTSPYRTGRVRGDWWKWKVDPLEVDAVLLYAEPGHGRRAGLYTDYTFGVWDGGALVPVAKAYSGLVDAEVRELDAWIRRHTVDKFGPVRQVETSHVFELHFDHAARSTRHKAGVALRFPRIARWRRDRAPADANTLADVVALIGGGPDGDG